MASSEEPSFFHWHLKEDLNSTEFHLNSQALFLLLIFFSLLVVITSLFLYVHWLCRYGSPAAQSTTTTTGTDTASIGPKATSVGLDPEIIASLPTVLVTTKMDNGDVIIETECSICLSLFESDEKVKVLPVCNHAYHSGCLDKWLTTQSSCPLCRASLGQ